MSSIPLGSKGFIYAMTSKTLRASNLIKIGAATEHPSTRAQQLTSATASPTPFELIYCRQVSDCNTAEAVLHERFAGQRVNDKREFFQVTDAEVIFAMDRVAKMYPYEMVHDPMPWAELFTSFDPDGPPELTPDEQRQCRELAASLYGT